MHHTADLGNALDQARSLVLSADPGSVDFRAHAYALSLAGQRITEAIEDAFVSLTAAEPEAA